jgi:bacterioferritin
MREMLLLITADPTTRTLLERVLAQEEEHANDMHDLLATHERKPTPKR